MFLIETLFKVTDNIYKFTTLVIFVSNLTYLVFPIDNLDISNCYFVLNLIFIETKIYLYVFYNFQYFLIGIL